MSKILSVFGATGNQGGSVIRAILADRTLSKEFKIRGVTRDVTKPAAKALAEQGVEMVQADMSSAEAAQPAVKGAHTVFLVTNFWETMSADTETKQGQAVVDASAAAGVKHIVFSSLLNVTEASGGALKHVSHFDSKARVEEYIRKSGVPGTFVMPGLFMSGMFSFLRKQDNGSYVWALPEGVTAEGGQVPLFDVTADTGKFVKAAIKNFPKTTNSRILAATDYYTPARIVAEFSEVTGKPAAVINVPGETFKSFLPPAAAEELLENMLLLQKPGYYGGADLKDSLDLLDDKPTTWKSFVEENKEKWTA